MPIGGTAFFGQNQHPRITTNYLNQLNRRGDPAPGVPVSTAQTSGSIVQSYDGQIGGKLTITNPWAVQFADPTVGPLYGGIYQYVQFDPLMITPAQRGGIAFWKDEQQYIVTTDYVAQVSFKPAGVIVNADYPGNWDFIQIAGVAMVLFGAALAIGASAGVNTGATPPSAGAGTPGPNYLGIVVQAAGVSGQVSPVEMSLGAGWNF